MAFDPRGGAPGETFANDTGKVWFQAIVQWHNSCGQCAQNDHMIMDHQWPFPYHFGCVCVSVALYPGDSSRPFVDFRDKIEELDDRQKNRVVGASNYKLITSGKADWSDVVTQSRIRDFREVVSLKKLSVKDLTKLGIDKRTAEEAFKSVNTSAHEIAMSSRERIAAAMKAKGLSQQEASRAVGERLAARFGIKGAGGPPPADPGPILPDPGPKIPPLTGADIEKVFGVRLKSAATIKVQVHGNPSAEAVKEVQSAVDKLSDTVRKKLADGGYKVAFGKQIGDVFPSLLNDNPRGWPEGMTWANADGLYHGSHKTALATEFRVDYYDKSAVVPSNRFANVLRHEIGHAFNEALGQAITKPEFIAAYLKDVARIDPFDQSRLGYYLQPGDAGRSEVFAEGFAQLFGGGSDRYESIMEFFSNSFKIIAELAK